MDDAMAESDVRTVEPESNLIDLYSVGHALVLQKWEEGKDEVPFKQTLQLKGPQGETVQWLEPCAHQYSTWSSTG